MLRGRGTVTRHQSIPMWIAHGFHDSSQPYRQDPNSLVFSLSRVDRECPVHHLALAVLISSKAPKSAHHYITCPCRRSCVTYELPSSYAILVDWVVQHLHRLNHRWLTRPSSLLTARPAKHSACNSTNQVEEHHVVVKCPPPPFRPLSG